jgi:hypothetical protein
MVEQCDELRYTDPLDKLRGTQAYRHGPSPRERMAEQCRLDTPMPSWEDIDTRIGKWLEVERQKFKQTLAARLEEERELWREVTAVALMGGLGRTTGRQMQSDHGLVRNARPASASDQLRRVGEGCPTRTSE